MRVQLEMFTKKQGGEHTPVFNGSTELVLGVFEEDRHIGNATVLEQ